MNHLAIYTALVGDYDELRQPENARTDVEFFCFSNDIHETQIGAWTVLPIPYNHSDPIRLARFAKLNPHILLPNHSASLWLDANITPTEEVVDRALELVASNVLFSTLPHSGKSSVYAEAIEVLEFGKGKSDQVLKQIRFLLSNRYPDTMGLKETCIVFRLHNHPEVVAFDNLWWNQLARFSTRDQLSCDYALWKTGLSFVPFSKPSILNRCRTGGHKPHPNPITPRRVYRWLVRMIHLRIAKRFLRNAF